MNGDWTLRYEGLDPAHEGLREALCTLGNGAFATRGAAEERHAGERSYPGTYVAGGYNQLASEVAGRTVVNEDLVNFPNWLWLTFRHDDGTWLDLWHAEVLAYAQILDMQAGVLTRRFRVRDAQGRVTLVESRRLVHMEHPSLAALEWRLVAENWSGEVIIRSGLDGAVTNAGVARYRQLANRHLETIGRCAVAPEGVFLKVRTTQSHLELSLAARTRLYEGDAPAQAERRPMLEEPDRIAEDIRISVREGAALRVEKVVALFTSRDRGISESGVSARMGIERAPGFEALLASHRGAWARLWRRCDLQIEAEAQDGGPSIDQFALRLHIFHMLQTASPNTVDRDVGVPARGLHGEAYRGHVFWDELFILPLYVRHLPAVARTVFLYRYQRLDAARAIARTLGCRGAAFPWQSSSDGREATQVLHLNPRSGAWEPDHSALQRHVGAAIVYNLWRYYQTTGDRAFMEGYGAEMILEIALFFSSLARRDAATGRYEIRGVMGPDEYHEKYPGAAEGGVRNNAYTNLTAVWCLLRAADVLEIISRERAAELLDMLAIDAAERGRWDAITKTMKIAFHDGVISQFEGYADLEELDWQGYRARYGDIARLDRILRAEGDTPDRYRVSKQPDVAMLFYLFGVHELRSILERLGYAFDEAAVRRNLDYYRARTSHGSTLSKVVLTSVVHRQDCDEGCRMFLSALRSDLYDVQGGTTPEGVHLGAMGGTVDIVVRHYAGLVLREDGVRLSPELPPRMKRIAFRFQYHGRWFDLTLTPSRLHLSVDDAEPRPIAVEVHRVHHLLAPGKTLDVELVPSPVRAAAPDVTARAPS